VGASYTIRDLESWEAKILEKVEESGLSCFPQEFEICDHSQMLGYMAYSGMPAHYPHWSSGKAYEKLKTLYDHGVSGLPYEMVINSNPSLAYLMRENSLCLQILTIAHVYGHNDFFRNNFTFRDSRPEFTLSRFKNNADRIRAYIEDPSIGLERVERILDAAHALSLQCRRHLAIRKLTPEEQKARAAAAAVPPKDPYRMIHAPPEIAEPDLQKVPLEPEEDVLLFIRDHNPYLSEWEQDLLTIVHQQAQYFLPQIETKIMNEGWASYWHHQILNSLEMPSDLHMEFLVHHNQVLSPHPGRINPYHLGFKIWHHICRGNDGSREGEIDDGREAGPDRLQELFKVREVDRDVSFLRRFLTFDLMRELDMYQYQPQGEDLVISEVADDENWGKVKETLLRTVGMNAVPVIRVEDANHGGKQALFLGHAHDGRDLELEYAEKTLAHVYTLWDREVHLETVLEEKKVVLGYDGNEFSKQELN
jgi:stage V sporulation protein R